MTILVELDPIGPDGKPTSTTVWCPACQRIFRVPFDKRESWLCACTMAAPLSLRDCRYPEDLCDFAAPTRCEWVRVGPNGRITTAELEQAKREAKG